MKRLILVVVVLAVLAVGAWWALQRFLGSGDFAGMIAEQISETMYAPVQLTSVNLEGTTKAVLTGFTVPAAPRENTPVTAEAPAEPDAPKAEPVDPEIADAPRAEPVDGDIREAPKAEPVDAEPKPKRVAPTPPDDMITIETIDARFKGLTSFGKDAHLEELTLIHPKVWMAQQPDGSIAWPAYTPRNPASEAPKMTAEKVTVEGASVVVADHTGFVAVEMNDTNVDGAFSSQRGFVSGEGLVKAKSVVLAGAIDLTDFQGTLNISPTEAKLSSMAADLFGGKINGHMAVEIKPNSQPLDLVVKMAGIQSSKFLQALGQTSKLDVGAVDIEFSGKGEMLDPLKVNGQGTFRTGKVDASGIPIMARLQKMAKDTGFADTDFAYMSGTFAMKDGVISFNDVATFPEESTRIFSSGTVDTNGQVHIKGEIHAKGGVAGGIEGFLSDIGLHKASESLFVIPFTITGTMADPQVKMKGP